MHEFSLCQQLLREAQKVARREYKAPEHNEVNSSLVITAITLRIGLFSGVDKGLMKRAFEAALHDVHCYWPANQEKKLRCQGVFFSPNTQLIIEEVSASVYCKDCCKHYPINQQRFKRNYLSCPESDTHKTVLTSGNDILITNLQMHAESSSTYLNTDFAPNKKQEGNSHV